VSLGWLSDVILVPADARALYPPRFSQPFYISDIQYYRSSYRGYDLHTVLLRVVPYRVVSSRVVTK
jgi:hypothetical protein